MRDVHRPILTPIRRADELTPFEVAFLANVRDVPTGDALTIRRSLRENLRERGLL